MSPRRPVVKPRDLVRVAQRLGFVLDRQKGSHAVFYRKADSLRYYSLCAACVGHVEFFGVGPGEIPEPKEWISYNQKRGDCEWIERRASGKRSSVEKWVVCADSAHSGVTEPPSTGVRRKLGQRVAPRAGFQVGGQTAGFPDEGIDTLSGR